MSTQQIPTVAQLAAARLTMWHQNSVSAVAAHDADAAVEPADTVTEDPAAPTSAAGEADLATEDAAEFASAGEGNSLESGDTDAGDETVSESEEVDADEDFDEDEELDSDDEDVDGEAAEEITLLESAEGAKSDQESVALLTLEAVREFLQKAGLLLFRPLPQMASAPAPTLVEATLGARRESPTLAEGETARGLLVRMVGEGTAVPLNLLGAPGTTGEQPDFIVSTAAFPYLFTLRGDKNWKQLPTSNGATKVSPLAVNTFALLMEKGPQSAAALTDELGKGITEPAVTRALGELWQQLRVLPVPQSGAKPTLWEPITSRFAKQIKAGANAGLPTALSALISLYLRQAMLATEEEVATFLSPLAARSRVREVLHGLLAAQQLEEMVIDGKTHVALAGEVPNFAASVATRRPVSRDRASARPEVNGEGRIKQFAAKRGPAEFDRGSRSKPFRPRTEGRFEPRGERAGGGGRFQREGTRPGGRFAAQGERSGGSPFRQERRFDRPWEEARGVRSEHGDRSEGRPEAAGEAGAERRGREDRPAFGRKGDFAAKPRFGGARPAFGRGDRVAGGDRREERGPRPPFSGGARDKRDFAGAGESPRGPRREFSESRPVGRGPRGPEFGPSREGGERAGGARFGGSRFGSGGPRPGGGRSGEFSRRDGAEPRAPWSGPRDANRSFGAERPSGGDRERRPFQRSAATEGTGAGQDDFKRRLPFRPDRGRDGEGGRPPFRRFDAPRFDKPRSPRPFGERSPRGADAGGAPGRERPSFGGDRGSRSREGSFQSRPGGARQGFAPREGGFQRSGPGDRASFSRRGAGGPKQGSPFEKFVGPGKGGAKPWGKRPPPRKVKPEGDEG